MIFVTISVPWCSTVLGKNDGTRSENAVQPQAGCQMMGGPPPGVFSVR